MRPWSGQSKDQVFRRNLQLCTALAQGAAWLSWYEWMTCCPMGQEGGRSNLRYMITLLLANQAGSNKQQPTLAYDLAIAVRTQSYHMP